MSITVPRLLALAVLLAALNSSTTIAQDNAPQLFNQGVAESNPLRVEQAQELEAYLQHLDQDRSDWEALWTPDFASPAAYERSTVPLRKALCAAIGYPPPGERPPATMSLEPMGEDDLGTYYRARIPILPQVNSEGIFIIPKNLQGRAPLVISMHGGGGSPEVALFHGGANYHDMVRGAVKRGYVVYAPQHLFSVDGYPRDIRQQIDNRLRLVGTTLTAVEIAKITRAIDVLIDRPEVDPQRIVMVGLSYGGYYALMTPALDPRIRIAVSSCYFGVQEGRYAQDELSVPSDFRFMNRMRLFQDDALVALICPRALQIQAGDGDNASHREPGERLAPHAAAYYHALKLDDRFQHVIFQGGHEFHDATAWPFVEEQLARLASDAKTSSSSQRP